jgi:peptide-methionine (R)-S-oxide reductase
MAKRIPSPGGPNVLTRRSLLGLSAAAGMVAVLRPGRAAQPFEITHTETEWRTMLTPEQYRVLRQEGTERPFTSPLNDEHRPGTFACAGCGLPLFVTDTKFNSGTGWPSFWQPIEGAVATTEDRQLGMVRTEVHCHRCGGHLGHVFDDGPKPTGLRYCMNGVAMTFTPQTPQTP